MFNFAAVLRLKLLTAPVISHAENVIDTGVDVCLNGTEDEHGDNEPALPSVKQVNSQILDLSAQFFSQSQFNKPFIQSPSSPVLTTSDNEIMGGKLNIYQTSTAKKTCTVPRLIGQVKRDSPEFESITTVRNLHKIHSTKSDNIRPIVKKAKHVHTRKHADSIDDIFGF